MAETTTLLANTILHLVAWGLTFLYLLWNNNLSPNSLQNVSFSRLQQRAQVGCDRLAKDAHSSVAPDLLRGPCLFYSCFVFLIRTFDFKHSSLSSNVIYSCLHKFHNYIKEKPEIPTKERSYEDPRAVFYVNFNKKK